jgi:hypothetical protein
MRIASVWSMSSVMRCVAIDHAPPDAVRLSIDATARADGSKNISTLE